MTGRPGIPTSERKFRFNLANPVSFTILTYLVQCSLEPGLAFSELPPPKGYYGVAAAVFGQLRLGHLIEEYRKWRDYYVEVLELFSSLHNRHDRPVYQDVLYAFHCGDSLALSREAQAILRCPVVWDEIYGQFPSQHLRCLLATPTIDGLKGDSHCMRITLEKINKRSFRVNYSSEVALLAYLLHLSLYISLSHLKEIWGQIAAKQPEVESEESAPAMNPAGFLDSVLPNDVDQLDQGLVADLRNFDFKRFVFRSVLDHELRLISMDLLRIESDLICCVFRSMHVQPPKTKQQVLEYPDAMVSIIRKLLATLQIYRDFEVDHNGIDATINQQKWLQDAIKWLRPDWEDGQELTMYGWRAVPSKRECINELLGSRSLIKRYAQKVAEKQQPVANDPDPVPSDNLAGSPAPAKCSSTSLTCKDVLVTIYDKLSSLSPFSHRSSRSGSDTSASPRNNEWERPIVD